MLGKHCVRTWSATQGAYALSSAEAELYAMIEGVTRAKGLANLARELGYSGLSEVITLGVDSQAAKQFVSRRGLGRMKHLEMRDLCLQKEVRDGKLVVEKVLGSENPADLMTKILRWTEVVSRLNGMGLVACHRERLRHVSLQLCAVSQDFVPVQVVDLAQVVVQDMSMGGSSAMMDSEVKGRVESSSDGEDEGYAVVSSESEGSPRGYMPKQIVTRLPRDWVRLGGPEGTFFVNSVTRETTQYMPDELLHHEPEEEGGEDVYPGRLDTLRSTKAAHRVAVEVLKNRGLEGIPIAQKAGDGRFRYYDDEDWGPISMPTAMGLAGGLVYYQELDENASWPFHSWKERLQGRLRHRGKFVSDEKAKSIMSKVDQAVSYTHLTLPTKA